LVGGLDQRYGQAPPGGPKGDGGAEGDEGAEGGEGGEGGEEADGVSVLQTEIRVDAPAERLWEVVANPTNLPRWDRHIVSVTGVPPGGLRKGTVYSTTLGLMGVRARVDAQVLELEPPRYSEVRLRGLLDAVVQTWVEPDGPGRSRLRHRVEYTFRGGPIGDVAARALRLLGAPTILRRGVEAQKRQAEAAARRQVG
jgi:uncharacterized protein YndB with AHSA1/START domain